MSAAFSAVVIAAGIVLGRLVARAMRSRRPAGPASPSIECLEEDARHASFAAFPCSLGDVVVRSAERDEAWLAGALLFAEDRPVAALFVAPEVGFDRAIFVRDGVREVAWLSPLAEGVEMASGEPPRAIEHGGQRFERRRRLPVRVELCGTGAPAIGDRAIVAEYAGPGVERVVVVAGADATLAWYGVSLAEDAYEVLPGGQSTLNE